MHSSSLFSRESLTYISRSKSQSFTISNYSVNSYLKSARLGLKYGLIRLIQLATERLIVTNLNDHYQNNLFYIPIEEFEKLFDIYILEELEYIKKECTRYNLNSEGVGFVLDLCIHKKRRYLSDLNNEIEKLCIPGGLLYAKSLASFMNKVITCDIYPDGTIHFHDQRYNIKCNDGCDIECIDD